MREDYDCEEFLNFCRRYGDDTATGILEDICCHSTSREWPWRIRRFSRRTNDREGANETLTGFLEYRAKCWWFKIENGNWNGTAVHEWERSSLMPGCEVPPQSVWLFASVEAVMVRIKVGGGFPALMRLTREILLNEEQI